MVRLIDKTESLLDMLKLLILFMILFGTSFFLIDSFALEVELQKESERIIESMGWLEPEKVSLQEQIQIVIDHTNSKNKISIGLLSQNLNDIRFPDYIEDIIDNPKIISFMITNQFACAPTQLERACIIIDVKREGLGSTMNDIRTNTREITDKIVENGIIYFTPKFHSVTVEPKTNLDGEKIFVARAVYTINKQPTPSMFNVLSNILISTDIRDTGGFYDHMKKLTENTFSDLTINFVQIDGNALRSIHVSVICSDKISEFIRCPENITEQITSGEISPLEFLQTESLSRSNVFDNQFLPLNSIVHVTIFSEQDLEIKEVNTNLIEKLENIGDVQENGWIFVESTAKIDARYIFGQNLSVSRNDLVFSVGTNTGAPITVNETKNGGGCLIATATFGSELSPQVQFLRDIRDGKVMATQSGSTFMNGFNQFYYSFSPAIADYERENTIFKEAVKITLTPLLTSLTLLQYVDIDSEHEMLGYGIGVILLNIGMYFVAPAVLIMKIKKLV